MSESKKLSVVISAYNEEKRIKQCLDSIVFADEIIFIDNSSTDSTVDVAKKFTKKIFTRPNNLMLNINKNFGFTKATGDWILCLDADEQITPLLKDEIQSVISQDNKIVGYWIPRKNIIFGKWIQHSGWYPDYQMRLFKRSMGKFEELHVHEMIQVKGEVEYLTNPMIHNNYQTISQFLNKAIAIYAPNESKELIRKGYRFSLKDSIRFPSQEFISRFLAREGYKDSFHGLMLAILMAFYHFIVFAFIWEQEKFKDIDQSEVFSDVVKESKNTSRELRYWFLQEKLKTTNNPFLKLLLKIKLQFVK